MLKVMAIILMNTSRRCLAAPLSPTNFMKVTASMYYRQPTMHYLSAKKM